MDRHLRRALWIGLIVFAIVMIRTAWLCDDAYITFRTVRNFVEGDGLRWNVDERVQTYTHPLWMFLLSIAYLVTRDVYYTTLALSIGISIGTVALICRRLAPTPLAALTCVTILVSSRSFVDYSTSGLENPLLHLLLALLAIEFLAREQRTPRDLTKLALLISALALTRLDSVLLGLPLLAVAWWPVRSRRTVLAIALGFTPVLVWELFSIVYYGFPFPNTYYAKLPDTIGVGERVLHGIYYLAGSARLDLVVAVTLVAGIAAPLIRRQRALYPFVVSIALYLGYILWIGGDYMTGRFLTAPLVFALISITRAIPHPDRRVGLVPAAVAFVLGLVLGPRASLISGGDYGMNWHWSANIDGNGISDERGIWYKFTGLIRQDARFREGTHRWYDEGVAVKPGGVYATATIGFTGWGAPKDGVIIDKLALGDPLLARLPPIRADHWRQGHIDRPIPPGYVETRRSKVNVLQNRDLARYYDDLTLATQGPIWSSERFGAIWRLNTGGDTDLLEHALDVDGVADQLAAAVAPGTAWNARRQFVIPPRGALYVRFPVPTTVHAMELCADHDDRYAIAFLRGGLVIGEATAEAVKGNGIAIREITGATLFDTVVIRPSGGDWNYGVACLRPL